ncbi:hypothetical protein ANN_06686 [Periplaneta americana]|uniref:DUF4817 domain-containing protein n=1 Tax=Periplaneta americana TaxID=6978 RepID=A0ABQ8TG18_PERAM|nr:hypothetical protein ANN_06686 [Periplaneta americana]
MAIHGIRESGKHKPQELRYEARSVIHADDFMQMFTQLKRMRYVMLALLRDRSINNNKIEPRLSFEQRKAILKWYWRTENVVEVQRQWRREYRSEPPTRLTIARIRDKFETNGTL